MKTYDVTITRYGCVRIEAESESDAMRKANELPDKDISWSEDWEATDSTESDD